VIRDPHRSHECSCKYKVFFLSIKPRLNKGTSKKDKAIPVQAWTGRECSRKLRLPDLQTVDTLKWQGCQV